MSKKLTTQTKSDSKPLFEMPEVDESKFNINPEKATFLVDNFIPQSQHQMMFHGDIMDKLLKLTSFLDDENSAFVDMPHLLFYGPPGSGKKTIIRLLLEKIYDKNVNKIKKVSYSIEGYSNTKLEVEIEQSNYHIIIRPNNSGLDKYLVQEIIKEYGKLVNVFKTRKKFKVVIIDSIDNLSVLAQASLRCTMEKYAHSCKFILLGNQVSKVSEPLKSRCLTVQVPAPSKIEIFQTLIYITQVYNLNVDLNSLAEITLKCNRNIKNAFWMTELNHYNNYAKVNWHEKIKIIVDIITKVKKNKITEAKISKIRSILYDQFVTNLDGNTILKELVRQLLLVTPDDLIEAVVNLAATYENQIVLGKRFVLHIEALIYEILPLFYHHIPNSTTLKKK